jgi:hypothetical protein
MAWYESYEISGNNGRLVHGRVYGEKFLSLISDIEYSNNDSEWLREKLEELKRKNTECVPVEQGFRAEFAEGDIESADRGTCARANQGKATFSLVPMHLLTGCSRVLENGSKKYAPWNWAKGGKWSTPFDCMMRHMFKWWYCGEEYDAESGEHHLDHAMCNLLFLLHYKMTYSEGDDRPPVNITEFNKAIQDFISQNSVRDDLA